ncbi:MAG: translation initiation factor IF-3 [Candidatus Magasanikbacteria bacterium]|nr:translation initiation factor IF-3 [Candidatus Magasanikbacteria bacterium]
MRISRKKRPDKPVLPHFKINSFITAPEVRLLDEDKKYIGILKLSEALEKAREADVDLVEVNPKSDPPVAQLMDFKHFKYQKEKEARKQKIRSRAGELKGIRLSIRIGKHDMEIRKKQAQKFLDRGDKVKVDVILKGAEKGKAHLAFEILKKFFAELSETVDIKFEQQPQKQRHVVSAIINKK